MPRNSVGSYTLPVAAFTPGTVIVSGDVNSDFSDIATALTQSLATTGTSAMTGPLKGFAGTVTAPGYGFNSSPGTGFFLPGADILAIAIASVSVGQFNASATAIWTYAHVFNATVQFASDVYFAGGINATVTVAGDLIVTGGARIGFTGAPTVDRVEVGDSSFYLDFDTGLVPKLLFDATDYFGYVRASNLFRFFIGGSQVAQIGDTSAAFSGFIALPEIVAPTSASADTARIYAKDNSGTTRVYYKDANGVETPMGGPGAWEEIGTFVVTTSVAAVNFALSKTYSRLVAVGVGISTTANITNMYVNVSDDAAGSFETITGMALSTSLTPRNATDAFVTGGDTITAASTDNNFWAEWDGCDKTTARKQFSAKFASNTNTLGYQVCAQSSQCDVINYVRVAPASSQFDAGTITLYGQIAL